MSEICETPTCFTAADGFALGGTLFRGATPHRAVLISSATGFPQRFYQLLARYLAARGALVMTYDCRGIGKSAVDNLARSQIDIPDWGRLDLTAAASALSEQAEGLPMSHIAHSVGGQLVGLMENHTLFDRHAFLAVGSGYWGTHQRHYIPVALYFWWGLGTWSLLRHGYLKTGGGWTGRPLSARSFRTWRRWAHRRNYLGRDLKHRLRPHWFEQVRAPIRSWCFSDDPIATPAAARTILGYYPNAPQDLILRHPADLDLRRIGHDGAFRPGREALWHEVWTWLDQPSQAATPQNEPLGTQPICA